VDAAVTMIAAAPALLLATLGDDGLPLASYVPFALVSGGLVIAVSGLAAHTANLLSRPLACALIVSEEDAPDGAYARGRISIDVQARAAAPHSDTAHAIWSALEERHGSVASLLRGLPDFRTFVLEPSRARLVLGFASAHDFDTQGVLGLIRAAGQKVGNAEGEG
jgi:putative heme iron utilization protein